MTTTIPEKKTALFPASDKVLIRPDLAEEKSKGGIFIPDSGRVKPSKGTIIAVGPGRRIDYGAMIEALANTPPTYDPARASGPWVLPRTIPVAFAPGQRVLYTRYAGTEVPHEGEDLIFLEEANILAVIEERE